MTTASPTLMYLKSRTLTQELLQEALHVAKAFNPKLQAAAPHQTPTQIARPQVNIRP